MVCAIWHVTCAIWVLQNTRRTMYMDASLGTDPGGGIYDCNLKLWKVFSIGLFRGDHANYSLQSFGGGLSYLILDVPRAITRVNSELSDPTTRAAWRSCSTPRFRIITRFSRATRRPPL
jgi:hypothetical protein